MTLPIPIAFVLPDLGGGGAQRVMLGLATGLDRERFSPHVLVAGGSRQFAHTMAPNMPAEIGNAARLRDGLPWLVRRIRTLRPRVIVSVMGYLNLALLAARPLLPRETVIVVREANVLAATAQALPRWLPSGALYRRLYPLAAVVVSPSERIASEIVDAAPRARIAIIPNPVDVAGLRSRGQTLRRKPGAGLRLITAGRLTWQKGIERLLPVLSRLPGHSSLCIFGSGPDESSLRAAIKELGLTNRVYLEGFSDDLPAWIAGADALLLPSRWEGLPNVVLESLALGTPVIASAEASVEDVQRAAPPGAVTIGVPENDFLKALQATTPASGAPTVLRPSLLPDRYHAEVVIAQWAELLSRLAHSPSPSPT